MTHSVLHSFTQSVTLCALWNVHETHFVAYSVTNFMKRFVTHSLTFSVTPLTFTQTVFWPLFFAANIKNDAIKKRFQKKRLILFPNFTKKWLTPWRIRTTLPQCVTRNAPQNALWDSFLDALGDAPNETFRNALRDVLCDTLYTHYGGE